MPFIVATVRTRAPYRYQLCKRVALLLLMLAFSLSTLADDRMWFSDATGNKALSGFLYRPSNEKAAPAVVILHGCSGLSRDDAPFDLYRKWQDLLVDAGYVVLMVDSAASRGFKQTCRPSEQRNRMWADRPADAYAALAFLQKQPFVVPERIALMGWSQGGGIVLRTIPTNSNARPIPPPVHDFVSAVAFYPGACSERLQTSPFAKSPPNTWTTKIPLLVLQGEADNWTPAKPCQAFVEAAQNRGEPVTLQLYPNAHHAFDAPDIPLHVIESYRQSDWAPIVGTNDGARDDARERVRLFLRMHFLKSFNR